MPRNFSPAAWKEPRIVLRAVIGALLAANLVAAVVAFKPFGGSAEDLQREEAALTQQLTSLRNRVANGKQDLVAKMQNARKDTDQFLAKYVTDQRFGSSTLLGELDRIASEAGVKELPVSLQSAGYRRQRRHADGHGDGRLRGQLRRPGEIYQSGG